jgi:1,2-phenylacetyl-CoA epoxidase catalytic subunit
MPLLEIRVEGEHLIVELKDEYAQRANQFKDDANYELLEKFLDSYYEKIKEIPGIEPPIVTYNRNKIIKHKKDYVDIKKVFKEIAGEFNYTHWLADKTRQRARNTNVCFN